MQPVRLCFNSTAPPPSATPDGLTRPSRVGACHATAGASLCAAATTPAEPVGVCVARFPTRWQGPWPHRFPYGPRRFANGGMTVDSLLAVSDDREPGPWQRVKV